MLRQKLAKLIQKVVVVTEELRELGLKLRNRDVLVIVVVRIFRNCF